MEYKKYFLFYYYTVGNGKDIVKELQMNVKVRCHICAQHVLQRIITSLHSMGKQNRTKYRKYHKHSLARCHPRKQRRLEE